MLINEFNRGQAKRVLVNPNKAFRDINDITAALEEEARQTAAKAAKCSRKGKAKAKDQVRQARSGQSLQLGPMHPMIHTFCVDNSFAQPINADDND